MSLDSKNYSESNSKEKSQIKTLRDNRDFLKKMKRLVDISISLSALVILFSVFLIVAYKVRKDFGSPLFFSKTAGKRWKTI